MCANKVFPHENIFVFQTLEHYYYHMYKKLEKLEQIIPFTVLSLSPALLLHTHFALPYFLEDLNYSALVTPVT